MLRRLSFKCCRTIMVANISNVYNAFISFVVFVKYPGCTRMILDMFRCRAVGDSRRLLQADQRYECFQEDHAILFPLAACSIVYTIGIPTFLYFKLTGLKDTIMKVTENTLNLRLQGFFLSTSRTATDLVYFWVEKVLLVGFIEIFTQEIVRDSTGLLQYMLNAGCTTAYAILIAMYMPPGGQLGEPLHGIFLYLLCRIHGKLCVRRYTANRRHIGLESTAFGYLPDFRKL